MIQFEADFGFSEAFATSSKYSAKIFFPCQNEGIIVGNPIFTFEIVVSARKRQFRQLGLRIFSSKRLQSHYRQ